MGLTAGISWEIALEVAGTAGLHPVAFTCCFARGKKERGDVAAELFDFSCFHTLFSCQVEGPSAPAAWVGSILLNSLHLQKRMARLIMIIGNLGMVSGS